jgi:hypothetical protein
MYCSTTDVAFGPVFGERNVYGAEERIESFLRWCATTPTWHQYKPLNLSSRRDPRELSEVDLMRAYSDWSAQEDVQWKAEEAAENVEEI